MSFASSVMLRLDPSVIIRTPRPLTASLAHCLIASRVVRRGLCRRVPLNDGITHLLAPAEFTSVGR